MLWPSPSVDVHQPLANFHITWPDGIDLKT